MARRVSKRVVQQALTRPCPSCGKQNAAGNPTCWSCGALLDGTPAAPASEEKTLVVDLSPEEPPPVPPRGQVSVPTALATDALMPKAGARRQAKSIWTRRITFGLEGQPWGYAALRTAMGAAVIFPPLFLLALVFAMIAVARGEPKGGKVLGWIFVITVGYCAILGGLVWLIISMINSLGAMHMGGV